MCRSRSTTSSSTRPNGSAQRELDAGRLRGDTVLRYSEADMVPNSPVTRANLTKGGMSALDLAKAAQQFSDNTAANLLIAQLDDPAGVTAKLRALGDPASRLDRYEPAMNFVLPGGVHDTTTPRGISYVDPVAPLAARTIVS